MYMSIAFDNTHLLWPWVAAPFRWQRPRAAAIQAETNKQPNINMLAWKLMAMFLTWIDQQTCKFVSLDKHRIQQQ